MSSSIRPATVIAATVGTAAAALVGYAVYFDHRRRTDPEFRKALKRDSKREAKMAKSQAEASDAQMRMRIQTMLQEIEEEGLPETPEAREEYFLAQVGQGERYSSEDPEEAALCFFRALKVYPNPSDLINIFDKTVPKPVLDILAELIARDGSIRVGSRSGSSSGSVHGVDD